MNATNTRQLYQFRVALRGISPQIWWRIQVWDDYTLDQFHRVLQVAMGWENYHLYEFQIAGAKYSEPHPENEPEILNAKRTRLCNVLAAVGTEFEYVYDFGDYCQHDLVLESTLTPLPDVFGPRCVAGERSGPPEDVGGAGGYEEYLQAIAESSDRQHEQVITERGPFDPERFSIAYATTVFGENQTTCRG